jgi:hypothetical protein
VSAGSNPAMPRHCSATSVMSDSGSETGAASRAHVWPDAVSLTAHSALTSTYGPDQVRYSNDRAVRDKEALNGCAGSDLANGFANNSHGRPRIRLDQDAAQEAPLAGLSDDYGWIWTTLILLRIRRARSSKAGLPPRTPRRMGCRPRCFNPSLPTRHTAGSSPAPARGNTGPR